MDGWMNEGYREGGREVDGGVDRRTDGYITWLRSLCLRSRSEQRTGGPRGGVPVTGGRVSDNLQCVYRQRVR